MVIQKLDVLFLTVMYEVNFGVYKVTIKLFVSEITIKVCFQVVLV